MAYVLLAYQLLVANTMPKPEQLTYQLSLNQCDYNCHLDRFYNSFLPEWQIFTKLLQFHMGVLQNFDIVWHGSSFCIVSIQFTPPPGYLLPTNSGGFFQTHTSPKYLKNEPPYLKRIGSPFNTQKTCLYTPKSIEILCSPQTYYLHTDMQIQRYHDTKM